MYNSWLSARPLPTGLLPIYLMEEPETWQRTGRKTTDAHWFSLDVGVIIDFPVYDDHGQRLEELQASLNAKERMMMQFCMIPHILPTYHHIINIISISHPNCEVQLEPNQPCFHERIPVGFACVAWPFPWRQQAFFNRCGGKQTRIGRGIPLGHAFGKPHGRCMELLQRFG